MVRSVTGSPPDPDPTRILEDLDALQHGLSAARVESARAERLETLGNLAGMIAHEMRGIASKIVGTAQLIDRDADDTDRARELADRIVRFGLHAGRVAEAILAAADEPIPGDASVLEIHRRALDALPSEARARIDDAAIDPNHRVGVDPDALERVLVNLYLNAWRAVGGSGQPGRIRMASAPTLDTDGKPAISIRVGDDGPGLPHDLVDSAFEPWSRGTVGSGHGLGLALCRHLVGSVGGSIRFDEPSGDRGAEAVVVLPVSGSVPEHARVA